MRIKEFINNFNASTKEEWQLTADKIWADIRVEDINSFVSDAIYVISYPLKIYNQINSKLSISKLYYDAIYELCQYVKNNTSDKITRDKVLKMFKNNINPENVFVIVEPYLDNAAVRKSIISTLKSKGCYDLVCSICCKYEDDNQIKNFYSKYGNKNKEAIESIIVSHYLSAGQIQKAKDYANYNKNSLEILICKKENNNSRVNILAKECILKGAALEYWNDFVSSVESSDDVECFLNELRDNSYSHYFQICLEHRYLSRLIDYFKTTDITKIRDCAYLFLGTKYEAESQKIYENYLEYKMNKMAYATDEYKRFANGLKIYTQTYKKLGAEEKAKEIIDSILVKYPNRHTFYNVVLENYSA